MSAGVRRYGRLTVLDGLDLEVRRHGRLAVVGPSGCGKSTLLSVLAGLEDLDGGLVSVAGQTSRRGRVARCVLMPQHDMLLPWATALDNACLALVNRGMRRREARERVRPMFARFRLEGFEDRRPRELSGGMRQRVAFVRTLAAGKDCLLLDEPFGALDGITRAGIHDWLRSALDAEPRTVVLVTHDVEEALLLCDTVAVMSPRPGRIVLRAPVALPPGLPRRELVATPEFVALRKEVMTALEER